MNLRAAAAVTLTLLLPLGAAPAAAADDPALETMVLTVEEGRSDEVRAELGRLGIETTTELEIASSLSVELGAGDAERLATVDDVVSAQPNRVYTTQDSQSPSPWNLDRLDQTTVQLDGVYSYPASAGQGVRIYVVDTGVDPHADLGARLSTGYSSITGGRGNTDCIGHGTHVAGTAAGTTYGVAKRASVVPVRVFNCHGYGDTITLVKGLDWILRNHPAGTPGVVNISLGTDAGDPVADAAIEELEANGLFVVVAAGNENTDACRVSPARVPVAYTIGATTVQDRRASFSNYGACLDVFAPGDHVASIGPDDATDVVASGTSMAAPHVAGVAALHLSVEPQDPPWQVTRVLDAVALPVVKDAGRRSVTDLLTVHDLGVVPAVRSADRLAGPTRYETAVAIGRQAFPSSSQVVLVAGSQASVVDGLVAAPFAKFREAPVLLSGGAALGDATRAELKRRAPEKVWLIGGTGVLGKGVERELKDLGIGFERLAGSDRYTTAAKVARRMPSGSAAVVASGLQHNLIDAAAVSGPAAADGRPILLTDPAALPAVTKDVIRDRGLVGVRIVGGPAAVSPQVERQLRSLVPVMRYGGADRYGTATAVATAFLGTTGADTVVLASGNDANLIDAMTGGVLGETTLLVTGPAPQPVTEEWIVRHKVGHLIAVGGSGAVHSPALIALRRAV